MSGLRKVIVSGELVADLLTNGTKLQRRGPIEITGGLPEGARFVYAEVERDHGRVMGLMLIFEHESWPDERTSDGTIPALTVNVREMEAT